MDQKKQSQQNEVELIDLRNATELSCRNDSHSLCIEIKERRVYCGKCGRGIRVRPQDIVEKDGSLFIKEGFGVPIDIPLRIV